MIDLKYIGKVLLTYFLLVALFLGFLFSSISLLGTGLSLEEVTFLTTGVSFLAMLALLPVAIKVIFSKES